ncbi:MAG: hypothetical protein P4M09_01215 [Devosia sp.]|nr:hypothetical protein [Devosia sp.]
MTHPDYQAPAELYLGRDWSTAAAQGPRAFRNAAKAIRFAIEEAAPVSLRGARLKIGGATFSGDQLTSLYGRRDYPLPRKRRTLLRTARPITKESSMKKFDYDALAELFPSRRYAKSQQAQYRRFEKASEAIRYIVEEMPEKWLIGSLLEVDEQRFEGQAIRALYDAPDYPLARQNVAA